MAKNTVPNVTDARAASKAEREQKAAKKDESITKERTLLYGQVLDMLDDAIKDDNVDDIALLKELLDRNPKSTAPEQPKQKQGRFSAIKNVGRNIANG